MTQSSLMGMKVSVSLPDDDVALIDDRVRRGLYKSRSAAIHAAIRGLRQAGLEQDYADAWAEWESSGDGDVWDAVSGDGLE